MSLDRHAHSASIEVPVPAAEAFAFMSDGMKQSHWALGSMNRRALGDNVFVGQSSFDGTYEYVKIVAGPNLLLVDYFCGPAADDLRPTVEARIKPGEVLGLGPDRSIITLTLWRTPALTEDRWERAFHVWKTEMHLIRGAIQRPLVR